MARTNQISGQVIGALDTNAAKVYRKSEAAVANADSAMGKAKAASDEADNAKIESGKAKGVASAAQSVARGARKEADSFAAAIKVANRDASEAKALLSEVRQLATQAESRAANAERKVADRHVSPAQRERVRRSLVKWNGMDIRFPMAIVNGDNETWTYASELQDTLCGIPGWSVQVGSETNNSGTSDLAVILLPESSRSDRLFPEDIATALHDAGILAKEPGPAPPGGTVMGARGYRGCGKLNPQHRTVDPNQPFSVNIEIQSAEGCSTKVAHYETFYIQDRPE